MFLLLAATDVRGVHTWGPLSAAASYPGRITCYHTVPGEPRLLLNLTSVSSPLPRPEPGGRTKAPVTAQGPQGALEHLLQTPLQTEEETGAQRREGSSRSLQGGVL